MAETDGLLLSIGIDIAALEDGLLAAEKSVKKGLASLRAQAKEIDLKARIELEGLKGAGDELDRIAAKERQLTELIENQNAQLRIWRSNLAATARDSGNNPALMHGAQTRLDQATLRLRQLQNELERIRTQRVEIQANIDTSRIRSAERAIQESIARIDAKLRNLGDGPDTLTRQFELQQLRLQRLQRLQAMSERNTGAGSLQSIQLQGNVTRQAQEVERLRAAIGSLNREVTNTQTRSQRAFGALQNGLTRANNGIRNTVSSFSQLNSKMVALTGAITGGYGLFAITNKAMNAGETLYKLSSRLHVTTSEAGKLRNIFSVAGTDIDSVIPILARLDKQVESATEKGNTLTEAMEIFGFTLTDNNGQLLGYIDQIDQLAKGYKNAVDAGMEAEYTANVLGARGAALVPLLEQYETAQQIVKRIKSTGLSDPKKAHEAYIEWQVMQKEVGQLTGAVGNALVPVANDLMPTITETLTEMVKLINDNKDGIKEFGVTAGTVLSTMGEGLVKIVATLGDVKREFNDITGIADDKKVIKERAADELKLARGAGMLIGGIAGGFWNGGIGAGAGALIGGEAMEALTIKLAKLYTPEKDWNKVAGEQKRKELLEQEQKQLEQYNKQVKENSKKSAKQSAEELKAIKKAQEEALKALQEAETEYYHATHSTAENIIYDINREKEARLAKAKSAEEAAYIELTAEKKLLAVQEEGHRAAESNKLETRNIWRGMFNQNTVGGDLQVELHNIQAAAKEQMRAARTAEEAQSITEKAAANMARAWKAASDKIKETNTSLQEKIFKLTHNERENQLFDLRKEAHLLLMQGADRGLVEQYYKLSMNKLQSEYDKEFKYWQEQDDQAWREGGWRALDKFRSNNPEPTFNTGSNYSIRDIFGNLWNDLKEETRMTGDFNTGIPNFDLQQFDTVMQQFGVDTTTFNSAIGNFTEVANTFSTTATNFVKPMQDFGSYIEVFRGTVQSFVSAKSEPQTVKVEVNVTGMNYPDAKQTVAKELYAILGGDSVNSSVYFGNR